MVALSFRHSEKPAQHGTKPTQMAMSSRGAWRGRVLSGVRGGAASGAGAVPDQAMRCKLQPEHNPIIARATNRLSTASPLEPIQQGEHDHREQIAEKKEK
jgi:hypothetical protein